MRTLLCPPPLTPGRVVVPPDEAHHGLRVLRLRVGDEVRVVDGDGRAAEATVVQAGPELAVEVGVVVAVDDGPLAALIIAVAPPKGDRWTELVRGLTELGVGTILPLVCARGERQPASLDRARRVAGEALKQSRRGRLPTLGPPVDVAGLASRGGAVIVADPAGGAPAPGPPRPTTLVVGPEGGLTPDELTALDALGAGRVRLARPILRIETAALAAAAVWATAWEHCPS